MSDLATGSGIEERADAYRSVTQREMRAIVGDATSGLYAWMRYHLGWEDRDGRPVEARRGKMLRPVGLLLTAEALGADPADAAPAAAAVELIHNFSLLHDDVEDASDFRHGRATVWTFAGTAQAINTGDGMFTVARLAQHRLVAAGIPAERVLAVMRELDETCMRLVEGQYLDISFESRRDVSLDEYVEMAHGKTAAMFAGPFAAGALIAGAGASVVDGLRAFGRHLGLAFQAVDDVLGIWGDEAVTGKPVGDDLRSRKMTYPIIYALTAEGAAAQALCAAFVDPVREDDIPRLAALVAETGAREATERLVEEQHRLALASLASAGAPGALVERCAAYAAAATGRDS